MPGRTAFLVLGAIGVVALLLALLFRRDLWNLAERGPRWRRLLFASGLALLAPLGLAGGCAKQDQSHAGTTTTPEAPGLESREFDPDTVGDRIEEIKAKAEAILFNELEINDKNLREATVLIAELQTAHHVIRERISEDQVEDTLLMEMEEIRTLEGNVRSKMREVCKGILELHSVVKPANEDEDEDEDIEKAEILGEIDRVWSEAEEVAGGRRGSYPFDRAGKGKLLANIDRAWSEIGKLEGEGRLTEAEAGLLRLDLELLREGVQGMRPTEMMGYTCYLPMPPVSPVKVSLDRLAQRLPLLEKMVESGAVKREVLEKVMGQIEFDLSMVLSTLATEGAWQDLDDEGICRALDSKYGEWPVWSEIGPDEYYPEYDLSKSDMKLLDHVQSAMNRIREHLSTSEAK